MLELIYDLFSKTDENNDSSRVHVYVNVYDMIHPNYITQFGYYALGVGVFHSGVEIGGKEYCFGGHELPNVTGVFVVEPKTGIPELTLKETFDMGTTDLTDREIEELLVRMSDEYVGTSYNLLTRNCNHFTEDFVERLTHRSMPSWINRAARLGAMFPCMVPWEWIQPPEFEEEATRETELDHSISRRSSTVSLLSNSQRQRSSATYHSTSDFTNKRSSSNCSIHSHSNMLFPANRFQGIIMPEDESPS